MPTPSNCQGGERAMRAGALRACRGRCASGAYETGLVAPGGAWPRVQPRRPAGSALRSAQPRTTPLTVLAPFFLSVNRHRERARLRRPRERWSFELHRSASWGRSRTSLPTYSVERAEAAIRMLTVFAWSVTRTARTASSRWSTAHRHPHAAGFSRCPAQAITRDQAELDLASEQPRFEIAAAAQARIQQANQVSSLRPSALPRS